MNKKECPPSWSSESGREVDAHFNHKAVSECSVTCGVYISRGEITGEEPLVLPAVAEWSSFTENVTRTGV